MSFDIFGPASKDTIKVGYISTDRGFVDGVSVCEANEYAQKNPGTRFIFKNREVIKYLGINDVNKLTPNDLAPKEGGCSGVNFESECGPPQVYFYGGGGVGVQGNPVIGEDGALLAIDLVAGGFGYQYEPIVEVKDKCNIGVGAVTRAVLGEIVETVEVFDREEDFEDYEICNPTDVGYGLRYGPDGKSLGPWEPTLYANLTKDPIEREIKEYQDFLRELKNPWWSTRKEPPLKMTSGSKVTRTKFDVTDKTFLDKQKEDGVKDPVGWNEFMNSYAISPVPPSNVKGSDFAGIPFTFEWEEDFPYDGEYIFRGLCDNKSELYLDNVKLDDLKSFRDAPNKIQKTIKAGVHRIRLDLLNIPIKEKVITQQADASSTNLTLTYVGLNASNNPINVQGNKILLKDGDKDDTNATFSIVSSDPGVNAKFSADGKKIEYDKPGNVTINLTWKDDPNSAGVAVQTISVGGITLTQKDRTGSDTKTFSIPAPKKASTSIPSTTSQGIQTKKVFNTVDFINKANRQLWRTNVYGRGGFLSDYGICPFDTIVQLQDNPYAGKHKIVWDNITFPIDGNYIIEIEVDDNVSLSFIGQSGTTTIDKKGFGVGNQGTGKTSETKFFKAGSYSIVAELEQIPGGKFGFSNIKDINPMALAINVTTAFAEEEVISAKSWNENPMGVALTIDAPMPPIPQEPIPVQEGRCPNNPIWTTRFPNAKEKWWPVKFDSRSWSKFTNRYAISPVPPLSTKGSDSGGVVYRNTWDLDIPYDGFYALKGTVDNFGRILIDGKEILGVGKRGTTQSTKLSSFGENNPPTTKFFLTKGNHKIEVEVENGITETFELIDKKIFSTNDWIKSPATEPIATDPTIIYVGLNASNNPINVQDNKILLKDGDKDDTNATFSIVSSDPGVNARFSPNGRKIEYDGDGNVTINLTWKDDPNSAGVAVKTISVGGVTLTQKDRIGSETKTFKVTKTSVVQSTSIAKNGVTYAGPPLASYISGTLGPFLTPAFKDDEDYRENNMGKTWTLTWSNVDFPEDGRYDLKAEADDYVIVRVDGNEVGKAKVFEGVKSFTFNATKGKRTIEMEIYNIPGNNTSTFATNPVVFNVQITKKVNQTTGISKPWTENPMGISAIMIPPPCPKKIKGKGVVTEVIVDDPGNGFPRPGTGDYPVSLRLKSVVVENPGINYSCGKDQIQITPSNGAVLDYTCDTFGRIVNVEVLNPGLGFTKYPDISLPSNTGINVSFRPQFEVVRDPIVEPQKLIQVTDLVGLKQTGYVDGRAYYGAVFFKDGVSYAGFYETPGQLVQVYATLKESIDAQVTTRASAIQRQGTDITNNDPRLNIPGTPENLI